MIRWSKRKNDAARQPTCDALCGLNLPPTSRKKEPTKDQLNLVFLRQLPPFIGFGMVDNGLMIISGDIID